MLAQREWGGSSYLRSLPGLVFFQYRCVFNTTKITLCSISDSQTAQGSKQKSSAMSAQPIRVAISGGGLAGASLLHALIDFPHLDVHIFESAAAFKEAGLAIGVTRNAQAALDLMGPWGPELLKRAGAVPMRGVRFMIAQGGGQGEVIDEVDDITAGKRLTSIVHRPAYLQEFLANVPRERMHASKKLNKIDRNTDGRGSITLYFTDGTTHECDILIGADGIHSAVRRFILGNDPAASPRNTGMWLVMTLQPYAEAQASIGKGLVDSKDAREYSWIGKNSYVMHNLLSDGQLVQFVIASSDDEAMSSDSWHRTVRADEIKNLYQGWPPHLMQAIDEVQWSYSVSFNCNNIVLTERINSCFARNPSIPLTTCGNIPQLLPMFLGPFVLWATPHMLRRLGRVPVAACLLKTLSFSLPYLGVPSRLLKRWRL